MRIRRGALFTLVILAFVLGASACGGKASEKTTTNAEKIRLAEHHWRTGLIRWHRSMQGALDAISVIFASETSLNELTAADSKTSRRLERYETLLLRCSGMLEQLGSVPVAFALSGKYANAACGRLERGEVLIKQAVSSLIHNTLIDPMDPLNQASNPLGDAQADLTTAIRALPPPT